MLEKDAINLLCPVGRQFFLPISCCKGSKCALWKRDENTTEKLKLYESSWGFITYVDGTRRKYKGELWLYAHNAVDINGEYILLYRTLDIKENFGHCGLRKD